MTIERRHVGKRLSELVIHRPSGLIFLAGQVADDGHANISVQAQQVLANIDRLLGEAGSNRGNILSATIYLPDMTDFAVFNQVWEGWIPAGDTPARATVQAKLASPDYRIEISIVAAL
jgi:enamine deaminase RidA (YjgF/YER057c/UK114 family)